MGLWAFSFDQVPASCPWYKELSCISAAVGEPKRRSEVKHSWERKNGSTTHMQCGVGGGIVGPLISHSRLQTYIHKHFCLLLSICPSICLSPWPAISVFHCFVLMSPTPPPPPPRPRSGTAGCILTSPCSFSRTHMKNVFTSRMWTFSVRPWGFPFSPARTCPHMLREIKRGRSKEECLFCVKPQLNCKWAFRP